MRVGCVDGRNWVSKTLVSARSPCCVSFPSEATCVINQTRLGVNWSRLQKCLKVASFFLGCWWCGRGYKGWGREAEVVSGTGEGAGRKLFSTGRAVYRAQICLLLKVRNFSTQWIGSKEPNCAISFNFCLRMRPWVDLDNEPCSPARAEELEAGTAEHRTLPGRDVRAKCCVVIRRTPRGGDGGSKAAALVLKTAHEQCVSPCVVLASIAALVLLQRRWYARFKHGSYQSCCCQF